MESKERVHGDETKQSSNNFAENRQRVAPKEKIPESHASGSVEEKCLKCIAFRLKMHCSVQENSSRDKVVNLSL